MDRSCFELSMQVFNLLASLLFDDPCLISYYPAAITPDSIVLSLGRESSSETMTSTLPAET